jgi:hypothetical protein
VDLSAFGAFGVLPAAPPQLIAIRPCTRSQARDHASSRSAMTASASARDSVPSCTARTAAKMACDGPVVPCQSRLIGCVGTAGGGA